MRTGLLSAIVLALSACLPAVATALPGDPPIVPVAPADGASVSGGPAGVPVAFGCPPYRSLDGGAPSGAEGYRVIFSIRPDLDTDGELADFLDRETATPRPDGSCTSLLDVDDSATSPQLVGGRVHWQVARSCFDCANRRDEYGPVWSFVVRPSVGGALVVPPRVYAGHLAPFTIRLAVDPGGGRLLLERRAGARWTAIATAPSQRRAQLLATLPAGRQALRVVLVGPAGRLVVASRTLVVRSASSPRRLSAASDGRYRARVATGGTLGFTVAGGGRVLRGFRASVGVFCFGILPGDNGVRAAFATVPPARIAPDGSVAGLATAGGRGRAVLTGRVVGARFTGRVSLTFSTCTGARALDAVRAG